MARYKTIDLSPRFLAVDLEKQLLPGSFAHAVHHLLERDFDLSGFDARYRNDETGASAYPPGMLLKIILCAYAEGVISSRGIERLCREHVTFIALSGDSAPHFTTLAAFVSGLGKRRRQALCPSALSLRSARPDRPADVCRSTASSYRAMHPKPRVVRVPIFPVRSTSSKLPPEP